jgi:mRNA interferase RelE/StbE
VAGGTAADVMPYTVRVAPSAARHLAKRMPDRVGVACVQFVYGPLAADPRGVGRPLHEPFDGYWSAERGEYRVYYRIDDVASVLDILDMSNRNEIAIRSLLP